MIQVELPWRKRPLRPARTISLASVHRDRPVGVVRGMTDGEVTYLTDLFVMPRYRGHGRGRDLMVRFLEAAKGTTVILLTSTAMEFYAKFGFEARTALIRRPDAKG